MSELGDLRESVRQCLEDAGILAFLMKPERFAPPAAFVGPGDPYLSREGMTFGGEQVRLQVTVVVASGTNEERANDLDRLLLAALDALYALEGFDVGDVGQPGQVAINGEAHLAASIDLRAEIHRE